MLEDRSGTRSHVERMIHQLLRPALHPQRRHLDVTALHVKGEPISVEEARAARFEPFAIGGAWGGRWDTTWFRLQGVVPDGWAGQEVVARVNLGGGGDVGFTAEGLLWGPDGPRQGFHHHHTSAPVVDRAAGGERVDLLVEAAANPIPPWAVMDWPLLLPDPGGAPLYTLNTAELALIDRTVEALLMDLRVLTQLIDVVTSEPRNAQVFRAVARAIDRLDPRDVAGTAGAAREILAPVLAQPARPGHRITAVGHAHIDTAWLWPLRETRRKCARTFANQLTLMDRYPEYRFTCSQAQQYAWIRDDHPQLWDRIVDRVRAGQWEPVGGMWVEADANLPSGESLVRQFVHGKRFFLEHFGVETAEVWIPDVFGYSAALPQIARHAGADALITQKMSWNATNRFPHHTFWWEGHDGSRLLAHFPPAATYNGDWSVGELVNSVRNYLDHGRCDRSLYPFGYGDGGGGPTGAMLEAAARLGDLEGVPRVELGTVGEFLDAVREEADDLGVWVGELYLEAHRATYTTHADVKVGNRRSEEALREAELWCTAVALRDGNWSAYPAEELDRWWKVLLLHQFHDIIPGSGIHWVYQDSRRDHDALLSALSDLIARCQETLTGTDGYSVFNPSSAPRRELVELPDGLEPVPTVQRSASGRVLAVVEAPALGWAPVTFGTGDGPAPVTVSGRSMTNGILTLTWDAGGLLTSVWDHEEDREVLSGPGNHYQLHEDNPNAFDAWDVDRNYLDTVEDLPAAHAVEVVEAGPLRGGVRMERRFGSSRLTTVMRLAAGSRLVEFVTEVDWHERHRFLKVAFPVTVRSARATYEIQHGHVERPTVANTSWDVARFEVCAHRWADLSETDYGVALINDSKYGHDIRDGVLRLSLLRGPGYPDPEADQGHHRFAYGLLPHRGDLRQAGGVIDRAEAFNLPLDLVRGAGAGTPVQVDRPGVSVEAVKKADGGEDVVVRLCERRGARGSCRVTLDPVPVAAWRTDALERNLAPLEVDRDGAVTLDLRPFELVTLRLRPPWATD